jgi:WS/DGAT/MGAT family acyltransferase
VKQLGGQDATFLYLDSRGAHLTLTGLYVYQQPRKPHRPIRFTDIVRHVRSRLPSLPVFRQKLIRPPLDTDYPYWVEDPDFRLEQHIHRYRGKPPGSRAELERLVAKLHARPLDLSSPPWQMHVIEKLGAIEDVPGNCFALISRYHHSAIDGASGNALIYGLHGTRPADIENTGGGTALTARERVPGTMGLLARAAVNNLQGQVRLLRSIGGAVPGMIRSAISADSKQKSAPVPDTRFNGPVTADRVFHAISIPLAGIKAIRDAIPGATVNDVILAVCSGGLRRWLMAMDELPEDSLVAMVPVNLRSAGESDLQGNQVGMMFIPIFSDIGNPLARLRAIHDTSRLAKEEAASEMQQHLREIVNYIPAMSISSAGSLVTGLGLAQRLIRLLNCTITNVPSPAETLYLGRGRMVYMTGAGPILDGMGLIISLFTYREQVNLSLTSCPGMLPDPQALGRCMEEAFAELNHAARSAAGG